MKNDKWGGSSSSSDLTEGSTDVSVRFSRGLDLIRRSKVDEARQVFEDIINEDLEYAPAHFGLGCVFAFEGLIGKALYEWNRAVEIHPDFWEAHYALAWAYYDVEDQKRGYEHVSKAVESGVELHSVKGLIDVITQGRASLTHREIEESPSITDSENVNVITRDPTLSELVLKGFPNIKERRIALYIVVGGFSVRLFSTLFITPIDFRWESYHFWQIAYYTLHVGTKYLRMWDLGGMEYFWGPLPIWIQSIILWVFRTKSIAFFRLFNTLIGCATIFLAYRIGLRYGDATSAKISALIVAANPILIFNNVIGMEESLGVFFILLSLLVINDKRFYGGLFLGLASLCRIEFWPLSFGIIGTIFLFERDKSGSNWFSVLIGWMVAVVPYMIHLQMATGNAIYPFYWNFLGNVVGVWNPWYVSPMIRNIFSVILVASIVGYFLLLKYRERFGEMYILLITALGFSGYHGLVYAVSGTAPLFERFFVLDAALVSCLVGLFYIRIYRKKFVNIIIPVVLLVAFLVSVPYYVKEQQSIRDLNAVTDVLIDEYSGGKILSDMPMMTYRLVQKGRISHTNILGSLYANYQSLDSALLWLKNENATYLISAEPKAYKMLAFFSSHDLKDEIFMLISNLHGIELYRIDQTVIDSYLE